MAVKNYPKILHVSTTQTGGAALATLRLHKSLLDCGVNSRVLTLDGDLDNKSVIRYKPIVDFQKNTGFPKLLKSLLYRFNIGIGRYWRMHDISRKSQDSVYSFPVSQYRVENHPLVKWADIIHLHWCNNFINYPSFFKKIKKPIVWTFHDISIGYGGFHFKTDYDNLLPYYQQIESIFFTIKKDAIIHTDNITIVSLSKEMFDFTKKIDFLKDKNNYIIPNSVDTSLFRSFDKQSSRKTFGLPEYKTILLFVSEYVQTPSKGLSLLKQAINELNPRNTLLCIVGNHTVDMPINDTIHTRYFGKITDPETLSKLYSASDFLVVPSSQESFGQTPLESMACGTPVVVFPTGAMKEYVTSDVGIVCDDCTIEALKKGLIKASQKTFVPSFIREYVSENFSPLRIAQMYIDVYNSVIDKP